MNSLGLLSHKPFLEDRQRECVHVNAQFKGKIVQLHVHILFVCRLRNKTTQLDNCAFKSLPYSLLEVMKLCTIKTSCGVRLYMSLDNFKNCSKKKYTIPQAGLSMVTI